MRGMIWVTRLGATQRLEWVVLQSKGHHPNKSISNWDLRMDGRAAPLAQRCRKIRLGLRRSREGTRLSSGWPWRLAWALFLQEKGRRQEWHGGGGARHGERVRSLCSTRRGTRGGASDMELGEGRRGDAVGVELGRLSGSQNGYPAWVSDWRLFFCIL